MKTIDEVRQDERTTAAIRSPFRRFAPHLVIIGYFATGLLLYWRSYAAFSRPVATGLDNYDFDQSVWFLAWVPHALAHGLNPFFSNALMAPSGVNLAQNTESPLLGFLTAPLSPFLSPIERANVLVLLALPLSATSTFLVMRRWKVITSAAALGGLVFGFSAYMVEHNVELIFLPLVPLITAVLVSIALGHGSSKRLGVQLGLLVTAQFLISPEILAIVGIFALLGVVFVAIRAPQMLARTSWRPLTIAAVISGSLLAYPLWMMTSGPQHFVGRTWPTVNLYHNDALSPFLPGTQQDVKFGLNAVARTLGGPGGATGAGGYVGLLLLAIAGYLTWKSRRQLRTQVAFVLLALAILLSLGPYLDFDGHQSQFPLPFWLLDHVGLLNDILPSRVCFVTSASLACLLAFGIDDRLTITVSRSSSGGPVARWPRECILFAGIILGILISTPLPTGPGAQTPPLSLPAEVQDSLPTDDPITITYPYATFVTTQTMLWQSDDDFRFRLLGGYAYHPNSSGGPTLTPSVLQPSGLQHFLVSQNLVTSLIPDMHFSQPLPLGRALVTATRGTLKKYDVQLVIVDTTANGSRSVVSLLRSVLGDPSVVTRSFCVWIGPHHSL